MPYIVNGKMEIGFSERLSNIRNILFADCLHSEKTDPFYCSRYLALNIAFRHKNIIYIRHYIYIFARSKLLGLNTRIT